VEPMHRWRSTDFSPALAISPRGEPEDVVAGLSSLIRNPRGSRRIALLRDLGEIPDDIAALVADTGPLPRTSSAYDGWEATNCANPLNWTCGADEAGAMFATIGDLTRQFDAWRPYTP
jgi:hypothetical protein